MSTNNYKSPWGADKDPKEYIEGIFNKSFKGSGKSQLNMPEGKLIILAIAAVFVIWIFSGFYIVQEGEQAAVTRFGKFTRVAIAGANYHLPYPIESITKVKVNMIQREEIGFRSSSSMYNKNSVQMLPQESLMLTGDENIADINFFVQWRITDIEQFLFNVQDVQDTIKSAAESAMREVIGNTTIAQAQTDGRAKVEFEAKTLLQRILDEYKSGIIIENLQLLKVDPPQEVIDAFRDVQTARADKERKINQAEAYRKGILPQARGEAAKIIQDAEGYKGQVIAQASGDAEKFKSVYAQYVKAKDVTQKRMYLETMEQIMANMNKVIVSQNISKSSVPYLPLNQLESKTTQ